MILKALHFIYNTRRVRRGIIYRRCEALDGHSLGYALYGPEDGRPVLFLSGLGLDGRMWWHLLPFFAKKGLRAILLDTRGVGRTPIDRAFTIDKYAEDARAVLDAEQIAKAHVVGCSMGSLAAQILAADQSDRVDRLVLVTPLDRVDDELVEMIHHWRGVIERDGFSSYAVQGLSLIFSPKTLKWNGWFLRRFALWYARHRIPRAPLFSQMDALMRWREDGKRFPKGAIKKPTLILGGDDDTLVPKKAEEHLNNQIVHSQRLTVKDAGHALIVERPWHCAKKIAEFLFCEKR